MRVVYHILCIALVSAFLYSCAEEQKEVKKFVRPVRYQVVGYLGGAKIRTFSGTARTDKSISLSFRSSGIITRFDIRLGQPVKKGQLLAELDNVQARLNYENALSSQNSAESQMNTAKLALNRTRSLYEKGSASLSDFESAKNSYNTAKQSYESTRRTVAIQEEQVKYGYLYAPEDGVIASVNAEIDENVSPGRHIAVLNAGSEMKISLGLPESVINGVSIGKEVSVTFSALPGQSFKGRVYEVAPSVDPSSATYPVNVLIIDPSDDIRSGMAANVTFDFGEGGRNLVNTLVVPANAVGEDSEGSFVYLIEGDGDTAVVRKQRIEVGSLSAEGFAIQSGLKAGQRIATAGLQTLLDGQEVKLQ